MRGTLGGIHLADKVRGEINEIADALQGNLDKVVQHGKRADAIVKNMLLHSRQGSGEHRSVDINALVEESLNLAYHGARAEKQGFEVKLESSFDPNAGEVDVFPQEITRALLNLISNGFYAATKRKAEANGGDYEPTITAVTKNLGTSVEILIRDNGTGCEGEAVRPELAAKRLELVKEVVPDLARAGTLINPENSLRTPFISAMKITANSLKLELVEFAVRGPADLEGAFAAMAAKPVGAFIMIEEPILIFNVEACANLATRYRLPACGVVEFAQAGGFIGYGVDVSAMWRRAATFVDKILKGAKPAELPVEQATKFLTVINLKTAKTIGIDIPTSLLIRADEMIE